MPFNLTFRYQNSREFFSTYQALTCWTVFLGGRNSWKFQFYPWDDHLNLQGHIAEHFLGPFLPTTPTETRTTPWTKEATPPKTTYKKIHWPPAESNSGHSKRIPKGRWKLAQMLRKGRKKTPQGQKGAFASCPAMDTGQSNWIAKREILFRPTILHLPCTFFIGLKLTLRGSETLFKGQTFYFLLHTCFPLSSMTVPAIKKN